MLEHKILTIFFFKTMFETAGKVLQVGGGGGNETPFYLL